MAYAQDLTGSSERRVKAGTVRPFGLATVAAHIVFVASVGFAAALVLGFVS